MIIHTMKDGETLFTVAKKYGCVPRRILLQNGIEHPEELRTGDELVITQPTRTAVFRKGDTVARMAKRYAVTEQSLIRKNLPEIRRGLSAGDVLAVKGETPILGQAVIIGSLPEKEQPDAALLSLIDAAVLCGDNAYALPYEKSGGSSPIPTYWERNIGENDLENGAEEIRYEIKKRGMNGVVAVLPEEEEIGYLALCRFLLNLKKSLLQDGKTLLCKTRGAGRILPGELADGWILPASVLSCEQTCRALARCGTIGTSLLDFSENVPEGERHRNLTKIKAEFGQLAELGFMGIYFDGNGIRNPVFTMAATLFAPANYALFLNAK